MKLFAGYDGGGTKTACVLADETGRLLGSGVGGPSNYLYCGKEIAAASIREAAGQAFAAAGLEPAQLEAAYMASGAILIRHGESHLPFFSSCIDAKTVLCDSDLCPIWYAAVREAPAVVSIAGTGAVTYVCSPDELIRVSGWGPLVGDEGSGYDLGLHAVRLVMRMSDKREPMEEDFVRTIFGHFGVETRRELRRFLDQCGDQRSTVASVAKQVFVLYERGSAAAEKLLIRTADEIALAVSTAAREGSAGSYPVVFSGSLVRKESALIPMLKERLLKPGTGISEMLWPEVHPAAASAALALHAAGLDEAVDNLLKNVGEVLL